MPHDFLKSDNDPRLDESGNSCLGTNGIMSYKVRYLIRHQLCNEFLHYCIDIVKFYYTVICLYLQGVRTTWSTCSKEAIRGWFKQLSDMKINCMDDRGKYHQEFVISENQQNFIYP